VSSEGLHVPREKLKGKTLNRHYAITSLIEELEAVDWYRQRADDCDDPVLEWLRRNDEEVNAQLTGYLFKQGSIAGHEAAASGKNGD
jgi:uncharacterized protein